MSSENPPQSQATPAGDPSGQAAFSTPEAAPAEPAPARETSQVLYRRWRPQTFAEVVGQEAVTRTLRNSVASGRIGHAYLLTGPRGTGKTTLGRLIAKTANCASPLEGEPCNQCESCQAFIEGRALDFVEQDAASHNSVEDIRQLRENVVLNPMSGRYKVYLLDEVHMLSGSAENALLKTLEEPPPHIIFVLATTEPHRVSSTIISRCQRFDLRRIPTPAVVERLARICGEEGLQLDEVAMADVARSAGGSLRDAINGLEQIVTYYGPSPTVEQAREALGISVDARSAELARLSLSGELTESLKLVSAVRDDGTDMRRFSREVVSYLRALLLVESGAADTLDETQERIAEMQSLAREVERGDIVRALKALGRLDFREDPLSSLPLELTLVELASEKEPKEQGGRPARPAAPERRPEPAAAAEEAPATAPAREPQPEPSAREEAPAASAAVEAEAEETPAPAGVPGDLLERLRDACKDTDKQLAALLNQSCEVKSLAGEELTLGFYHTFHLERMEAGGHVERLNELLSQELGRSVRAVLTHSPRRPTPGKVKSGHLVQAARELGAKPIGEETGEDDG